MIQIPHFNTCRRLHFVRYRIAFCAAARTLPADLTAHASMCADWLVDACLLIRFLIRYHIWSVPSYRSSPLMCARRPVVRSSAINVFLSTSANQFSAFLPASLFLPLVARQDDDTTGNVILSCSRYTSVQNAIEELQSRQDHGFFEAVDPTL